MQGCLDGEMQWLANLPWPVWALLSSAVGEGEGATAPRELRSSAIAAAHTSVAFIDLRVFKAAKQHPWGLAQGDIAQNLEKLKGLPEPPVEPTAQTI